ncbi:hypothetical protein I3843_09G131800 [Carya illinoinensis]|uniref:Seipin n=1 Tax=Carya illinoinensis TaxID=32201 RepID=A0A8T1PKJ5_CARIL|nr:seipin-2-like [Carya illinoinensis]KAG2689308.1 hypothetical protein I3760_09G133200 [Carya illinoinensis]KAG6642344.1 hypothetical protein CIPAW_09G136000 [Carya illinoinensis]KAG7963710.1 hypothetical protein I3843_09G131800 [Carya illinoinensis]
MESLNPNVEDDDVFLDAPDEFPFYDCLSSLTAQPEPSTSSSTLSSPAAFSTSTLRRRSPSRLVDSNHSILDSDFTLGSEIHSAIDSKPRFRIHRNLKESQKPEPDPSRFSSVSQAQGSSNSTVTTETDTRAEVSAVEANDPSSHFLIYVAGLLIKAISFQINLFVTFTTLPLFLLYHSYMLVTSPFQTVRRARDYLIQELSKLGQTVGESLSPLLNDCSREHKWVWKVALRWGWGFLWSVYVCIVLCSLLVSSLVVSGVVMRFLVQEPIQMKKMLNFDYTKPSPVAYVPIVSCDGVGCGEDCKEQIGGFRFIPPNHRLQVTVSLTLPESEYNRNLGVFQIRVGFLSASGKTLASLSHPCMLLFKSEPIRLLLTFLKIVPLVTGYVSESQTLNLKFRGFTEGKMPTACLKIIIEQRAEYHPGAGIPEIYDASLILESELPLFKRIIWYWKKTLFIWMAMMSFMMQLLFTLVCCRSIIIPKARPRDSSAGSSDAPNGPSAQG